MGRAWWWVLAWAAVIEWLVLWPSPPQVSEPFSFIGLDKLVHGGMFAVQAMLAVVALRRDGRARWSAVAIAAVGVAAFGALTEVEQHFVPTRSMEFGDFVADALGAMGGALALALWAPRRRELDR